MYNAKKKREGPYPGDMYLRVENRNKIGSGGHNLLTVMMSGSNYVFRKYMVSDFVQFSYMQDISTNQLFEQYVIIYSDPSHNRAWQF